MKNLTLFLVVILLNLAMAQFEFSMMQMHQMQQMLMMEQQCERCKLCDLSNQFCKSGICGTSTLGICASCKNSYHCDTTCATTCNVGGVGGGGGGAGMMMFPGGLDLF